mgnify:CR=1 FL=1
MVLDLSELEHFSHELIVSMEEKIAKLDQELPQLNVQEHLAKITQNFTEMTFMPLDDVWERELGDLLDDIES